jgi:hypothetical protein
MKTSDCRCSLTGSQLPTSARERTEGFLPETNPEIAQAVLFLFAATRFVLSILFDEIALRMRRMVSLAPPYKWLVFLVTWSRVNDLEGRDNAQDQTRHDRFRKDAWIERRLKRASDA